MTLPRLLAVSFFLLLPLAAEAQLTVRGTVVDPSGAAVGHAAVALRARGVARTATTDELGRFVIGAVAPGRYAVDITGTDAFAPLHRSIQVAAGAPPLVFELALAAVTESVEVTAEQVRPTVDTAANLDTTTVSGEALEQMPVLDQDIVAALTPYLDAGSLATGGTTITVDGMEMKRAGVPKSAIQEISINSDPYSAESSRPGRGRIDIMTKPGSTGVRGELDFTFRNASLASRSYFAPAKAPEQRRSIEGMLTGPVGRGRDTSFLFTFTQQTDDANAVVHALTPAGAVDQNVATPATNSELMGRLTHDWSERERGSFQVNWHRETANVQKAGGVVLPQAGLNTAERETSFFATLRSFVTPERFNQFQLTVELNRQPALSVTNAPALVVRDAFVGGGAQATLLRTESGGKLNDIFTAVHKDHVLKFGVQIPNLNRRVFDDQTNQQGTFTFASLADYAAGRPDSYTVQQGNGHVAFWWREYGVFAQDQFKIRPNLQASFGLRYDWQAFFHDRNNVSPRASLAWSPGKDGKTVIRTGAGVFYDRSGVAPVAALFLHNGTTLRSYTIFNPSYPDPFAGGRTLAGTPVNIIRLAGDVQIPYTTQYSATAERQLTKSAAVVLGYRGSRGQHLFRSVNVNAPMPPGYTTVPDPTRGQIQELRSDGRQKSDSLELTLRGQSGKRLNGQLQYTYSHSSNDTGGIFWYPADQYGPPGAEWGPADYDQRHRLNALATIKAGRWFNLGISGRYASALPYSQTAGIDLFHTALSNARLPGVGRNTLRGRDTKTIDIRWSHEVPLSASKGEDAKALTIALDAFNVLNHANFSGYIGNVRSPFYLTPTTASPGRRIQLSAEVKF